MKKQNNPNQNLGISVVEIFLFLGIVMAVLMGVFFTYASINQKSVVSKIIHDIQNGKEDSVKQIKNKEFLISSVYQTNLCSDPFVFQKDFEIQGITLRMKTQGGEEIPLRICTETDMREGVQWIAYAEKINQKSISPPEKEQEDVTQSTWKSEDKL